MDSHCLIRLPLTSLCLLLNAQPSFWLCGKFYKAPFLDNLNYPNCICFYLPLIKAVSFHPPDSAQLGRSGFWFLWTSNKVSTCLEKLLFLLFQFMHWLKNLFDQGSPNMERGRKEAKITMREKRMQKHFSATSGANTFLQRCIINGFFSLLCSSLDSSVLSCYM